MLQLLLLQLMGRHASSGRTAPTYNCSAHSHLLHQRHTVGKGDIVEVSIAKGAIFVAACASCRRRWRRRVPIGGKEGEIAAVAMVFSPLVSLLLLVLCVNIGIVAPFPQSD
jgi:hypothetical protein